MPKSTYRFTPFKLQQCRPNGNHGNGNGQVKKVIRLPFTWLNNRGRRPNKTVLNR